MSSSASEARDTAGGRLGGARADFVASLGRKISDARDLLTGLEGDPSSKPARDELRRRLHALGSGARLLRFEAMAKSLQEVLAVLDRGAQAGGLREQEVAFVAQAMDDLPALAWGDTRSEPARESAVQPAEEDEVAIESGHPPIALLVVGAVSLAEAAIDDGAARARTFECERTQDANDAMQLARAYAPDLVIVDADLEHAADLVEALLDDPLTEPVPVIVVGTFRLPDETSRFVALGVAKCLTKPVGAEAIRSACDEVLDARHAGAERTIRVTLGEPTLEHLAERLAQELKSALVDGVDRAAHSHRVPLGEGTEILGALWGAIARIQEVISQKTRGAIRYQGETPDGAVALAPWLHQDLAASDRLVGRGRGAAGDVRLTGRRVVVADDDPGVTWFLSDLLRTAGCDVHEALDGTTALALAHRVQPELVISDILMPGVDGFALCRALRRDLALRDTPVMLLSWKEDLLQRVRELGASAAAYMRKESDSRAVLARVREVLRPRARIELRLRGTGEVRGRLDGLSPRLLLELVCAIRKDARVAVRDASFLYEIEIRAGAPRKVTRTAGDGATLSGVRALAPLLGVGAGRFVVASSSEPVAGELSGTLFELLTGPLAAARGAIAATTGPRAMEIERIGFDATEIEEYLRATPEPTRGVIRKLAEGISPRQLLLGGEASPALVEDILVDLASRGAVQSVTGPDQVDLLGPAVAAARLVMTGEVPPRRSVPPSPSIAPRTAFAPAPRAPQSLVAPSHPAARSAPAPKAANATPAPVPAPLPVVAEDDFAPSFGSYRPSSPFLVGPSMDPPAPKSSRALPTVVTDDDDDGSPSSLEDAVMREISDRSPVPKAAALGGLDLPPILDPSQLRPRSSNPPANPSGHAAKADAGDDHAALPSIPPDAIVPEANSNEEFVAAANLPSAPPPHGSVEDVVAERFGEPAMPSLRRPPVPVRPARGPDSSDASTTASTTTLRRPPPRTTPGDDSVVESIPQSSPWKLIAVFAVLGAVVLGVLHLTGEKPGPGVAPPATVQGGVMNAGTAGATTVLGPATDERANDTAAPAGSGVVEIAAPGGARVTIDGVDAGSGPVARGVVAAGYHEVRIDDHGHDSHYTVDVRAGKTTRVKSAMLP